MNAILPIETSKAVRLAGGTSEIEPRSSAGNGPSPTLPKTVRVRLLRPDESELVRAHLTRLGPQALRSRFGNAVNAHFIENYARRAIGPDAVVKGLFVDGRLRGIAELRFLDPSHTEAEAAFSIEPAFQSLGHGDRLFAQLVATARNRGVRRLFLTCLRENRRMQAIAARHGAELSYAAGDVTAEIRRPYADAASIAREWADESEAFAFAMMDWRRKNLSALVAPVLRMFEAFNPTPSRLPDDPAPR